MIASVNAPCFTPTAEQLQARFLELLPRIETHARIYFRHLGCRAQKDEALAETVALAWRWFVRLAQRGKDAGTFVSALATLAARAVQSGRRLCGQESATDVLSPSARRRHGFTVEALPSSASTAHERLYGHPRGQHMQDAFEERLRDNTQTPVPEQVSAIR